MLCERFNSGLFFLSWCCHGFWPQPNNGGAGWAWFQGSLGSFIVVWTCSRADIFLRHFVGHQGFLNLFLLTSHIAETLLQIHQALSHHALYYIRLFPSIIRLTEANLVAVGASPVLRSCVVRAGLVGLFLIGLFSLNDLYPLGWPSLSGLRLLISLTFEYTGLFMLPRLTYPEVISWALVVLIGLLLWIVSSWLRCRFSTFGDVDGFLVMPRTAAIRSQLFFIRA